MLLESYWNIIVVNSTYQGPVRPRAGVCNIEVIAMCSWWKLTILRNRVPVNKSREPSVRFGTLHKSEARTQTPLKDLAQHTAQHVPERAVSSLELPLRAHLIKRSLPHSFDVVNTLPLWPLEVLL